VSTVATTEIIAPDGSVLAGPVPAFSAGAVSHPIVPVNALTPAMRFFGWVDGWAADLSLFFIALALIARMRVRLHRNLSDEESSVEA
jgi:apolipoprotein N-acyltransferase